MSRDSHSAKRRKTTSSNTKEAVVPNSLESPSGETIISTHAAQSMSPTNNPRESGSLTLRTHSIAQDVDTDLLDLLDDLRDRREASPKVKSEVLLGSLALPGPLWRRPLIRELGERVETVERSAPARQVRAVFLEVASSNVQHEQTWYDGVWVSKRLERGRNREWLDGLYRREEVAVDVERGVYEWRPAK